MTYEQLLTEARWSDLFFEWVYQQRTDIRNLRAVESAAIDLVARV